MPYDSKFKFTTYKEHETEKLHTNLLEYFDNCKDNNIVPTKEGMNIHLGITSQIINNWNRKGSNFRELGRLITRAHQHIKVAWLSTLISSPAGQIFYLKSAFHMKEHVNNQETIKIEISNRSGKTLHIDKPKDETKEA